MARVQTDLRAEVQAALEGDYVIERELGRGGMGAVFLARDVRLDRPVAIKVLPPELAVRAELRERFLRETRTAASFSHPNIVPVHAVEVRDQLLCFVMGFVEGESLAERLRRAGPMSGHDAARLLQEVAWALSYAHGRGVVHRDIKPDNILIERATGRAMVTDFGIARSSSASALTSVGDVVGTPQFMSPEQASGDAVDGRSDLYSLGIVGFCAVTGHAPFSADSTPAILAMQITKAPPPIAVVRPDLLPALTAVIERCLAKAPEDRFQTGEAVADALDAVRAERPEVAAAIRLFQQKSATLVRNALILACFLPLVLSRFGYSLDRVLAAITLGSAVGAMLLLALLSLRELARQGFHYDELRAGLLAISRERLEVARLARSAPDWRPRRRRRRRMLVGMGVLAIVLFLVARGQRIPISSRPGVYSVTGVGIGLFALAFILGMMTVVFASASNVQASRMDGWISRLWTSGVGGGLFRLVSRGVAVSASRASVVSATSPAGGDPRTLFGQLPAALRRRLKAISPALERLEQEERAARKRIAALEKAEQDALAGRAIAAEAEREHLVADLRAAHAEAEVKLASVLEQGETLRLALVRLGSGLGTVENVKESIRKWG